MGSTQLFKQRYENLWRSAPSLPEFVRERGFDFISNNQQGTLLFVGINPSYKDNAPKNDSCESPNCRKKDKHPYFEAIERVSMNCGFKGVYTALDILAVRTPYLSDIKDAIKKHPGFKDFCVEQFKIFKDMLRQAKPCAIVVCNAYAREWMSNKDFNKEAFEFSEFDDAIGTWRIKNDTDLEKVPVFFSGMFSGKHILDNGSRERLEWQIRRAKEKHLL